MANKSNHSNLSLFPDLPEETQGAFKYGNLRYPIWTKNKARLVQLYLQYFVYITKHGTYIDGFAGPQRENGDEMWAAKLVLEMIPKRIRYIHLFDIGRKQIQDLKCLQQEQLRQDGKFKRTIRVYEGDFNERIHELIRLRTIRPKQATFCLLDQRTFECKWSTVEALARYKEQGNKIELFYFLPMSWLGRSIAATKDQEAMIAPWWGGSDWRKLLGKSPRDVAKLFSQKFTDLGYKYVAPWPIYDQNQRGTIMYFMIHATDHPEAPALMRRAYFNAVRPLPSDTVQYELFDATNTISDMNHEQHLQSELNAAQGLRGK